MIARRLGAVVVISLTSLALVSCTEREGGSPRPATEQAAPSSSRPSGDSPGVFGDVKACELLDQALQGSGYPPGRVSNTGSYNGCQTNKSGTAASLDLDDRQAYDKLQGDLNYIFDGDVSKRPAKLRKEPPGGIVGCSVSMKVAAKARAVVGIGLGANGSSDEACEQAMSLATAVESQLPALQ